MELSRRIRLVTEDAIFQISSRNSLLIPVYGRHSRSSFRLGPWFIDCEYFSISGRNSENRIMRRKLYKSGFRFGGHVSLIPATIDGPLTVDELVTIDGQMTVDGPLTVDRQSTDRRYFMPRSDFISIVK